MIQNISIKEDNGCLFISDISSGKQIALMLPDRMTFFKEEPLSKETIIYIANIYLDFEGYIRIYKDREPGLFDM